MKDLKYREYLSSVDKEIVLSEMGLKITEDPLILVEVIKKYMFENVGEKELKSLEIGAGQGIISILLSNVENFSEIHCVEIQEKVYNILLENIVGNRLENKLKGMNVDINFHDDEYDIIFSNPPYMKLNSGKLPKDEILLNSKYEKNLTLDKLVENIKRLLKNYGTFFIIIPDNRLNDVLKYIYEKGLNVLSLNIKKYKKRDLIVIVGKKGGKYNSGMDINIL